MFSLTRHSIFFLFAILGCLFIIGHCDDEAPNLMANDGCSSIINDFDRAEEQELLDKVKKTKEEYDANTKRFGNVSSLANFYEGEHTSSISLVKGILSYHSDKFVIFYDNKTKQALKKFKNILITLKVLPSRIITVNLSPPPKSKINSEVAVWSRLAVLRSLHEFESNVNTLPQLYYQGNFVTNSTTSILDIVKDLVKDPSKSSNNLTPEEYIDLVMSNIIGPHPEKAFNKELEFDGLVMVARWHTNDTNYIHQQIMALSPPANLFKVINIDEPSFYDNILNDKIPIAIKQTKLLVHIMQKALIKIASPPMFFINGKYVGDKKDLGDMINIVMENHSPSMGNFQSSSFMQLLKIVRNELFKKEKLAKEMNDRILNSEVSKYVKSRDELKKLIISNWTIFPGKMILDLSNKL